jgi:hypothetical protein
LQAYFPPQRPRRVGIDVGDAGGQADLPRVTESV